MAGYHTVNPTKQRPVTWTGLRMSRAHRRARQKSGQIRSVMVAEALRCHWARHSPLATRHSPLPLWPSAYKRQDRIHRHGLVRLVSHFDIPRDHALRNLTLTILLDRLLFAREARLNRVADIHGLHESKALETIVGEHRARGRIDEQASRSGQHEVPVRHPPLEE